MPETAMDTDLNLRPGGTLIPVALANAVPLQGSGRAVFQRNSSSGGGRRISRYAPRVKYTAKRGARAPWGAAAAAAAATPSPLPPRGDETAAPAAPFPWLEASQVGFYKERAPRVTVVGTAAALGAPAAPAAAGERRTSGTPSPRRAQQADATDDGSSSSIDEEDVAMAAAHLVAFAAAVRRERETESPPLASRHHDAEADEDGTAAGERKNSRDNVCVWGAKRMRTALSRRLQQEMAAGLADGHGGDAGASPEAGRFSQHAATPPLPGFSNMPASPSASAIVAKGSRAAAASGARTPQRRPGGSGPMSIATPPTQPPMRLQPGRTIVGSPNTPPAVAAIAPVLAPLGSSVAAGRSVTPAASVGPAVAAAPASQLQLSQALVQQLGSVAAASMLASRGFLFPATAAAGSLLPPPAAVAGSAGAAPPQTPPRLQTQQQGGSSASAPAGSSVVSLSPAVAALLLAAASVAPPMPQDAAPPPLPPAADFITASSSGIMEAPPSSQTLRFLPPQHQAAAKLLPQSTGNDSSSAARYQEVLSAACTIASQILTGGSGSGNARGGPSDAAAARPTDAGALLAQPASGTAPPTGPSGPAAGVAMGLAPTEAQALVETALRNIIAHPYKLVAAPATAAGGSAQFNAPGAAGAAAAPLPQAGEAGAQPPS